MASDILSTERLGSLSARLAELDIGSAWTTHIWTGAVSFAALTCLLLTYAITPTAEESRDEQSRRWQPVLWGSSCSPV
ncbi:MAG: hypothetical protein V5A55_00890 [Halovenus sp.]